VDEGDPSVLVGDEGDTAVRLEGEAMGRPPVASVRTIGRLVRSITWGRPAANAVT
jgi:hypothetical protein